MKIELSTLLLKTLLQEDEMFIYPYHHAVSYATTSHQC